MTISHMLDMLRDLIAHKGYANAALLAAIATRQPAEWALAFERGRGV
jgi:hypothetical protein